MEVKVLRAARVPPLTAGVLAFVRLVVSIIVAVVVAAVGLLVVRGIYDIELPATWDALSTGVLAIGILIAMAIIVAPAVAALKAE